MGVVSSFNPEPGYPISGLIAVEWHPPHLYLPSDYLAMPLGTSGREELVNQREC